jgi:ABC-type Fe3+/spermidine/putrescine transport system ATPase subunit
MLTVAQVEKAYTPGNPVLHGVSVEVADGEVVCLLGPSGCGKTTLLRIVAGLEQADRGQVLLDGRNLATAPVHQRQFGFMFQDFALFPHRTVAENVAFGLRMAGSPRPQISARVQEMLRLVNLEGYGERSIFALSGGERQRVALARSLAPHPRLLLLDEPLGSLDRTLRDELMNELRRILKAVHVTALYVTHDQQEAFAVADRLVVMRAGRIEQIGTPHAVYHNPANGFVARFLGLTNLLPVQHASTDPGAIVTPLGHWRLPAVQPPPDRTLLLIRPEAVQALHVGAVQPAADGALTVTGVVRLLSFRGATYRLQVDVGPRPGVAAVVEEGVEPRKNSLSFDVAAALITPHLAQLDLGAPLTLQLDGAALSFVRP